MIYFWHFLTYHRKSPYHGKNIRTISWFFMIWHRNIAWNKPMVITVSWAISFCFLISWENRKFNLIIDIMKFMRFAVYSPAWDTFLLQTKMGKSTITILLQNNGDIAGNIRGIFCWNITNYWLRNSHQTWASILWENHRRNWEIFQQALLDYQKVKMRS